MTALGFDPWAVLKSLQQGAPPPKAPKPPNPPPVSEATHPTPATEALGLGELGGLGGGWGPQCELQDRAAFLLRAAEDAFAALAGPELGPVLQVGQLDHDEAERTAMAAFYAEPGTIPATEHALVYCFPCGKPVLLGDRTWSEAGGLCCAACLATRATSNGGLP